MNDFGSSLISDAQASAIVVATAFGTCRIRPKNQRANANDVVAEIMVDSKGEFCFKMWPNRNLEAGIMRMPSVIPANRFVFLCLSATFLETISSNVFELTDVILARCSKHLSSKPNWLKQT